MSAIGSDGAARERASLTGRGRTIATLVVLLAFFMDILDSTIVNVAIPSIRDGLGASYSAIQWIIAGYSLAFALFLITGGRLGDIVGYKKMFLIGIAGFTVASALSGLATSTEMLIGARLLQGLMAALMVPQILSTIQIMYTTTKERQGISAFYGGIAGIATVLGPIIGALLITGNVWGLGWRTIFLVNLPVGDRRDGARLDLSAGREVAASAEARSRRRRRRARRDADADVPAHPGTRARLADLGHRLDDRVDPGLRALRLHARSGRTGATARRSSCRRSFAGAPSSPASS